MDKKLKTQIIALGVTVGAAATFVALAKIEETQTERLRQKLALEEQRLRTQAARVQKIVDDKFLDIMIDNKID